MSTTHFERGTGDPALLLMPGWCATSRVFAPIRDALAKRHRVISVDWPGHGASPAPLADFGFAQLAADVAAIVEQSESEQVVPVALSHAGWVAIELRRRLRDRIPTLVLLDWIVLDPPPPFLGALAALQQPQSWQDVRDALFSKWRGDPPDERVSDFLNNDMASFGFEMWARAGREIAAAYRTFGKPLAALAAMPEPPRVCHIYAQPRDENYLVAQQSFAREHPWFSVARLDARTHFPMFEVPAALATTIELCASTGRA